MRPLLAFALLLAAAQPAAAQMKTYKWEDNLCTNTVRYDPRKVDLKALEGTVEILDADRAHAPVLPFVETPADIAKIDLDAFSRTCAARAARLRALRLLPLEGIEEFRQERARQIDDACVFGLAYGRGYRDPSALRSYARASPHCDRFVDALEGKGDMTALWRKQIAEGCVNNASPAACRRRYEDRGNGRDGEAWKRHYLTSFGWNNCATEYTAFNGEGATRRNAMMEKLAKAFTRAHRVRQTCGEP